MREERTGFLPALGAVLGGVWQAEYYVRQTRNFGLMRAGAYGINRVWSVDDVAAVALSATLHQIGGQHRAEAVRRLREDPEWRDAVLESFAQALCFEREVCLELGLIGGVAVTATVPCGTVGKLAALVDDWGRLRDAWETRRVAA